MNLFGAFVFLGLLVAIVLAGWLLYISATTTQRGYIGYVFRFGELVKVLQPGLKFIIPFVDKVEFISLTTQDEFPAEEDDIDRENSTPIEGMVAPIRIIHRGMHEAVFYQKKDPSEPDQDPRSILTQYKTVRFHELPEAEQRALEQDSVNGPLTSEVIVAVEWSVGESLEEALRTVTNLNPGEGRTREEEFFKRVNDRIPSVLQELLARVTLGHAKDMVEMFNRAIQERLEVLIGEREDPRTGKLADRPWGVHIREAYIKTISAGRRVNEARANAASAVSEAQATVTRSEADAQATKNNADAQAHATRANADAKAHEEKMQGKGEADRIREMMPVMQDENGRFVAMLDVAEKTLPHMKATLLPFSPLLEAITSMGEMFGGKKKPTIIP